MKTVLFFDVAEQTDITRVKTQLCSFWLHFQFQVVRTDVDRETEFRGDIVESLISPRFIFKLGIAFSPVSWLSAADMLFKGRLSREYLRRAGVLSLLSRGATSEISIVTNDLARIHKLVRSRRPKVILEFGVGFSTLVLAHALEANGGEGELFTVDASDSWLENTRQKLPDNLKGRVKFWHSDASVSMHNGRLVSKYDSLPNIVPQFIYLDGPSPRDIKGQVSGLDFSLDGDAYRHVVAADILLYESSLLTGTYVLVDRRYANVQFLMRNLQRKWKVHWDRVQHQVGLELRDITGRSTSSRRIT